MTRIAGDAEIEDLASATVQAFGAQDKNVCRLDVPMNDLRRMEVFEPPTDFERDAQRELYGQSPLFSQEPLQVRAIQALHHYVGRPVHQSSAIAHANHIFRREARRDAGFARQLLGCKSTSGHPQDLYCYLGAELEVFGFEYLAHTPTAEHAEHSISTSNDFAHLEGRGVIGSRVFPGRNRFG